ncbi:response regulator [Cohnella lupini]|uniref:Two-component system response regulator YesN n=1 Tax=Cohnella lupini TaxID=1294267 RepID=A0A3D9IT05_9BACL|nr:response regulator [Cohnella lupini]RED64848.1 two-component system response regulator YesN [Cohnella lupini]
MIQALIVDDESLVRKGLRLLFPWEKYGIEIAGETATGEKAMEFLRSHPVQLLMTDITMPGMSGIELTKQAQELDPSLKVVILTCHQDFEFIQEALRLGAIDYIVKTQLEELDLDKTLERIVKAVNRNGNMGDAKTESVAGVPGLRRLADAAAGVLWIVDDELFGELVGVLAASAGESAGDIVSVLQDAMERWRRSFPAFNWDTVASSPVSAGAAERWLHAIRVEVGAWLRKSAYSEDVIRSILKAVDRIAEQPGTQGKQEEISRSVNLSKSYFSTSFRDITRMTFSHFLQATSVYAARDLLESTNHPVYWIAERCGFADQRHFSKLFKEQTGFLPSEYRQRHKECN